MAFNLECLDPAKLSMKRKDEIEVFLNMWDLPEFTSSIPFLKMPLKDLSLRKQRSKTKVMKRHPGNRDSITEGWVVVKDMHEMAGVAGVVTQSRVKQVRYVSMY